MALKEKASELFAQPPNIEEADVLVAKLPEWMFGAGVDEKVSNRPDYVSGWK